MSNPEHGSNGHWNSDLSSSDISNGDSPSTPLSGSESDVSSIILHNSADSEDPKSSQVAESSENETPGRPDRSISEYADAYVKMMETRESGQLIPEFVATPQDEGVQGSLRPLQSSNGLPLLHPPPNDYLSSSHSVPYSSSQNGRTSPPSSSLSNSTSPVLTRQTSEASSSSAAPSYSSTRRDPVEKSSVTSINSLDSRAAPSSSRRHRRRSSSPLLSDADLEGPYSDDEGVIYDAKIRSSSNSGNVSSSVGGRGIFGRPIASLSSSNGSPLLPSGPKQSSSSSSGNPSMGSRVSKQSWHSRKKSTASSTSGSSNSDSPRASSRNFDSSRDASMIPGRSGHVSITAGGIMYAPALKRSAGSSGHSPPHFASVKAHTSSLSPPQPFNLNSGITNTATTSTKATLFYIRRRIHTLRALSLLLLILTLTLTLISWTTVAKPLLNSQERRTNGCASSFSPPASQPPSSTVSTPSSPSSPQTKCYYFYHDMASFVVVTGVWLAAGFALAVVNVSASFMFYWRRLTRITLVFNLSMLVATVVVLNWVIVLVAFTHEPENWRVVFPSSSSSSSSSSVPPPSSFTTTFAFDDSNHQARQLKSASIALLVAVSLFWAFSFFISLALYQLRRYIMSKPRYCCWPLEGFCCAPMHLTPMSHRRQLRRFGRTPPNLDHDMMDDNHILSNSSSNGNGIRSGDVEHELSLREHGEHEYHDEDDGLVGSGVDDGDDLLRGNDSVVDGGGVELEEFEGRGRKSSSPHHHPHPRQHQAAPQSDLSPIIASLQGIQSTVNSLAEKVHVIEQREAVAAPSGYADPFAYGRQPPRF